MFCACKIYIINQTKKHSGHWRTLEKCRKHSPAARTFYISLVFLNACRVLSQCNTRLRLLYLLKKEMDGSQRWFRLTLQSVKFRLFSMKNVSLRSKSNGQCLAYVHPIWDALGQLGERLGSQRCSRLRLEQLLRYLRALPTIQVHPKLDGRVLDIVHCLNVRIHQSSHSVYFCALDIYSIQYSSNNHMSVFA